MHSDSFVEMSLNRKAKCLDQKWPIPKFPLSSILLVSLICHLLSHKLLIFSNATITYPGVETGNLESSLIVLSLLSTTIAILKLFYFCLQNVFQSVHITSSMLQPPLPHHISASASFSCFFLLLS